MKVYLCEYNSCTYESDFGVVSVHATLEGADTALKYEIAQAKKNGSLKPWMEWRVRGVEVKS